MLGLIAGVGAAAVVFGKAIIKALSKVPVK